MGDVVNLVGLSVESFLRELSSASAAPGGGSVAALSGALAAALCEMVAGLTVGKEKYRSSWKDVEKAGHESAALQSRLRELVDEDTRAFLAFVEARRLPRGTACERRARERSLQEAILQSAKVPLSTLCALRELSAIAGRVTEIGNPSCVTDAGSAAQMIRAGAVCAAWNVRVNLPLVRDTVAREELSARTAKMLHEVMDETQRIEGIVEDRLARMPGP